MPEQTENTEKTAPQTPSESLFNRFRSRINKMLNAMKQQPEAEDDEPEENDEDESFDETDIDETDNAESSNVQKLQKSKPLPKKAVKRGFLRNLRLDSYEQPESADDNYIAAQGEENNSQPIKTRQSKSEAAQGEETDYHQMMVQQTRPADTGEAVSGQTEGQLSFDESEQKTVLSGQISFAETEQPVQNKAPQPNRQPRHKNSAAWIEQLRKNDTVQHTEQPEQSAAAEQTKQTGHTRPAEQIEISSEKTENNKEEQVQNDNKPENAETAQSTPEESNVIYKAPERKAPPLPPPPKAPKKPAVKETVSEKPAPKRKELPAFDIFAEFAKEQKKQNKPENNGEKTVSAETKAAETEIKPETAEKLPVGETAADNKPETAGTEKAPETSADNKSAEKENALTEAAKMTGLSKADETRAEDTKADNETEKSDGGNTEKTQSAVEGKLSAAVASEAESISQTTVNSVKAAAEDKAAGHEIPSEKHDGNEETAAEKSVKQDNLSFESKHENDEKPDSFTEDAASGQSGYTDNSVSMYGEPYQGALPDVIHINSLPVQHSAPDRIHDNVIYDAEPAPEDENEKDLTEGHIEAVTYHYSDTPPFIVMAGKFTRTLRTEYEAVRAYNAAVKAQKEAAKAKAEAEKQPKNNRKSGRAEKKPAQNAQSKTQPKIQPKAQHKAPQSSVSGQHKTGNKTEKPASPHIPLFGRKKPSQPAAQTAPKSAPAAKKPAAKAAPAKSLMELLEKPVSGAEKKSPQEPEKKMTGKPSRATKAEIQSAAKAKKTKKKFSFRELFSDEEDYDPDDEIVRETEQKPQLDDYTEESDADAIRTEINTNFQSVFARTVTLLACTAAAVVLSLIAQCTGLFSHTMRNGWLWYAVISFILFVISVIASRNPIVNGLMPLRRFKGNSDTAVAVAAVAAAMQGITALFTPDIFLSGKMFIYTPLVILALFCNSAGKLLIITRTHNNFNFLTKPYPKFAGKIFNDKTNADKMVKELPTGKPIIGYTRRTKFMSNFLQLSYAPDPSEKLASTIAPWTTAFSLACGILYGLISRNFAGGLSSFALTACMSVPVICLLAVNIPLRRLCRSSLRNGAMITSYETVKQFCDTNAVMIDSSQLYPKGSVTLSGMKSFKQSMLNDALLAGAAIMYAVNGTMIHVFENIVQCSKNMLPRVDNVVFEDGKGLEGWVRGQRVLIGNRELLISHNIEPPEKEVEERHYKNGNDITYITVGGELIAMFILSYKTNKHIANELKELEQNGVSFIIRTVDANLTREFVAERFGLFYRCITVVPTGLGNICNEAMSGTDDRSRAYLLTRGKLSSFAKAVSGCIKMKSNVTISKILQMIALGLGLIMITMISFVSGFEKLGCLEMLIYTGFWSITSIIATIIRK